ncbi:MAG: hypothetical protein JXR71_02010 [Bacteroidales bacterium]|nr:hypothetical protein [Bacteroidales bacterium]
MKNVRKIFLTAFPALALVMFSSCHQKKENTVVTPKIQYDVSIKSPDASFDWWIQNIAGPQREQLVSTILNGALSGKYQAYDYFYKPISREKVAQILNDTLRKTVQDKNPPYELKDTLIIKKITIKNIVKLRFLEKWEVNENTLSFEKKVLGIAPIARITDPSGNTRWQPLFWLFPDKSFLKELKKNQLESGQ